MESDKFVDMTSITANLQTVRARLIAAARDAGRDPDAIKLLAVSKTWPAACVRAAFEAGQRAFGENYAQEAAEKITALADLANAGRSGIEWHFIGSLQSNKTRIVAEQFDWAHSVDRLKIAERLSAQRPQQAPPLQICLQINVSGEASKSGVSPDETLALARAVAALPRLRLRGLMCIPEPDGDQTRLRQRFALLRQLLEQLRAQGCDADTLSMGMSHDLETAITEGATIVRIGTAIFGERKKTAQT